MRSLNMAIRFVAEFTKTALIGGLLVVLATRIERRPVQLLLTVLWAVFVVVWFGVGLTQIADGLL